MGETVAILMATYNGEKYIAEQIESILNQTYKDWFLFISDDGSKDATLDIIQTYLDNYNDRIRLIGKNGHKGAKNNFNYLLQQVQEYAYYMFADQDDIWVDEKIEIQLREMLNLEKKNGKDKPLLVFSDMKVVDESLGIISDSFFEYSNLNWKEENLLIKYLIHNYTAGCCMLCNHNMIECAGNIPECATMHDYWIALVAAGIGTIKYIDLPLNLYRQHGGNAIGARQGKWKISNLKSSFSNDNIEKLRKEKKEKNDMACELLLRYYTRISPDMKRMIQDFSVCNKKRSIIKILLLNKRYKLKLSVNYIFLLMLKI